MDEFARYSADRRKLREDYIMASVAKKFLAVLGVIILAAAVIVTMRVYFRQKEERSDLREISAAASKLNSRKRELEDELLDIIKEYQDTISSDMCVTLFFDNLTDNLVEEAYPLLSQYGYRGTIVMCDMLVPGDEGCISRGNFKMMINRGWDTAIGKGTGLDLDADNAPELLGNYLDEYIEKLQADSIPVPTAFCFGKGEYDPKFDSVLSDRGFKIVRYTSDNEYSSMPGGMNFINSRQICAASVSIQGDVEKAYEKKGTIGVHVRYIGYVEDEYVDCNEEKYLNMLSHLKEQCPDAKVLTASELCEYKETALRENEAYIEKYSAREREIREELENIELQLEELYARIN